MSASHHGSEQRPDPVQQELLNRLMQQFEGKAKRQYSAGRMSADDDGDLSMGIAADGQKKLVIVRFGKPIEWIGMSAQDAVDFAEKLIEAARKVADKPISLSL